MRDMGLLKPETNKNAEGESTNPDFKACRASYVCVYNIQGKCTGALSVVRLNNLLHAYNQTKQINIQSTMQPPVQDSTAKFVGMLQR
jgi:hypothetical protein